MSLTISPPPFPISPKPLRRHSAAVSPRPRRILPPLSCSPNDDSDTSFSVVTSLTTLHNNILVVDAGDSRVLLLDSTHNIHSVVNKHKKWTGSYWDEFATLPAIVPEGPIAILGLGGGTAAHLMLELWPSLKIEGWEIDGILIDMAREYFGLSKLEQCTEAGGSLTVHIGDALSPAVSTDGGFAGIIVDLFADGKILPQLLEDKTWLELGKKLMPHGRLMVNCSGSHSGISNGTTPVDVGINPNDLWVHNSTIQAMAQSFPGELSWKRIFDKENDNFLALTGPLPDLNAWSSALPSPLSFNVKQWKPCQVC